MGLAIKIAAFDEASQTKISQILVDYLKSELVRPDDKKFCGSTNLSIGFGVDDQNTWISEDAFKKGYTNWGKTECNNDFRLPDLAIELGNVHGSLTNATSLFVILRLMFAYKIMSPIDYSGFCKAAKCCMEMETLEDVIDRRIYMFDGSEVKVEDPKMPFLDVVYEHWEEAMMHLTLNGEVQNEEQQS